MGELFGTLSTKIDWVSSKERFSSFPNSAEVNLNTLKEISRAIHSVCNHILFIPLRGFYLSSKGQNGIALFSAARRR